MSVWDEYAERYQRLSDQEKRKWWNELSEDQREYLKKNYVVKDPYLSKEPLPEKSSSSPSFVSCVVLLIAMFGLFFVILFVSMGDEATKTSTSVRSRSDRPAPQSSVPKKLVYAKDANVNIRSGPGMDHPVVGKTNRELQPLEYQSLAGDWYKLASEGEVGDRYIHRSVVLSQAEKERRDSAVLELVNWSWSTGYGYATAEGLVKNVSAIRQENIEVVVTFLDASGNMITTGSALIDYNPILPGQTSPFKAMARFNPAMEKARIDFKRLLGGSIDWYRTE